MFEKSTDGDLEKIKLQSLDMTVLLFLQHDGLPRSINYISKRMLTNEEFIIESIPRLEETKYVKEDDKSDSYWAG